MAQSRQTPRVWSDAIRVSEILANWLKLGTSAVFFWLSIGIALGAAVGGFWFLEGTTSLDRRLWVHHVRNGVGIGGLIADLPNPDGSGTLLCAATPMAASPSDPSTAQCAVRGPRPLLAVSRRRMCCRIADAQLLTCRAPG